MYVFNDRERTDYPKKDHIGAKIDFRAKFMGKYNYIVVFRKLGDPVPMALQQVNGSGT